MLNWITGLVFKLVCLIFCQTCYNAQMSQMYQYQRWQTFWLNVLRIPTGWLCSKLLLQCTIWWTMGMRFV